MITARPKGKASRRPMQSLAVLGQSHCEIRVFAPDFFASRSFSRAALSFFRGFMVLAHVSTPMDHVLVWLDARRMKCTMIEMTARIRRMWIAPPAT
jgi:hypothetical protein